MKPDPKPSPTSQNPQLADFGLTRIIKDAHGGVTNHSGAGGAVCGSGFALGRTLGKRAY
jgi:hypothetical protein